MFNLLDGQTTKTARALHARASEAAERYLGLSPNDLEMRVASDFLASHYWKSGDTIALHYDELPDFSFMIIVMLDKDTLSIQAGGPFSGFILQDINGRLWTSLIKPAFGPFGGKAKRLAKCLEDEFGIKNASATIDRFRRQFR